MKELNGLTIDIPEYVLILENKILFKEKLLKHMILTTFFPNCVF